MVQCTSSTQTNHFPVADAILSIVLTTHFVLPYLTTCTTWYAHSLTLPSLLRLRCSQICLFHLPTRFTLPTRSLASFESNGTTAQALRMQWITTFLLFIFFFAVNVCICHALARTGLSLWWIFSKSSEWTLNGTRTEKNSCSVGNWIFCARFVALAFCCAEYFCVTHHSDGLNANENKKHIKLKKQLAECWMKLKNGTRFLCVLWVCWVNETTKYRFAKSLDLKDISSI